MGFPELDLDGIFDFHPATEVSGPMHDGVRRAMKVAAEHIRDNVPASAEKTLAIRHLQMAMMLANSAVAQHSS